MTNTISSSFNSENNDHALIAAAKEGNTEAWGILYDKYAKTLYGIIYKTINNEDVSELVLQKCFLTIVSTIQNYNSSNERFLTWMLAIARNIANETLDTQQNGSLEIQQKDNIVNEATSVLDLVFCKGLSIDEAAKKLNLTSAELRIKLRTEIKQLKRITIE